MTKTCTVCNTTKPLTDYYSDARNKDGRQGRCKICHNAKMSAYQRTPQGKANVLARVKKYQASEHGHAKLMEYSHTEKYKIRMAARVKAYKQRNPEKQEAHRRVLHELRMGRMTRQPCEVCGSIKAEAHHEDYSKPLSVRWLCKVHHEAAHHLDNL